MSTNTSVFLLITLWASMQGSLGLPVVKELEVEVEVADSVRPPRVRTKRCACSSQLDSECHYFCHLDIIWVNTPSKTTVYGLGNSLSRRRRSTSRCTCGNPSDKTCTNFCYHRPELNPSNRSLEKPQHDILSILRAAASRALDEERVENMTEFCKHIMETDVEDQHVEDLLYQDTRMLRHCSKQSERLSLYRLARPALT